VNERSGWESDLSVSLGRRLRLVGVLCGGMLAFSLIAATLRASGEDLAEDSLAGRGEAGEFPGSVKYVYKTVDGRKLYLEVFSPDPASYPGKRPAIVWWSGGGWQWGGLGVYERQCAYLASRGMIAVCAEYRYAEWDQHYSVAWAAEDAKSAVRWLRVHATDLRIDPTRVVAAGESSGATIALQTTLSPGFEATGEDLSIASKPDALVLFDPVTNEKTLLQPFIEKSKLTEEQARKLVPALNLDAELPPTFLSYSDRDFLFDGLEAFSAEASRRNLPVTLEKIGAQPHGFMKVTPWLEVSLESVDRFLATLGYVEGLPNIKPPDLPFDLDRAVFGKGLPTVTETEWFAEPMKALKIDKNLEVLQFSFATLTDGRTCAIAVSKSAKGFTEAQMTEVARTVTAWIDATWNESDVDGSGEEGKPVFCFMAFPFQTQAVWNSPDP
jgi:acetyl esterase